MGRVSHGGYCGPAVKPIALNMVQQVMGDELAALPMSGIGGVVCLDVAGCGFEFILLGCGNVQVCTAVMHYGYRVIFPEDLCDGLLGWMGSKGYGTIETLFDFQGLVAMPSTCGSGRI